MTLTDKQLYKEAVHFFNDHDAVFNWAKETAPKILSTYGYDNTHLYDKELFVKVIRIAFNKLPFLEKEGIIGEDIVYTDIALFQYIRSEVKMALRWWFTHFRPFDEWKATKELETYEAEEKERVKNLIDEQARTIQDLNEQIKEYEFILKEFEDS